MWFLAPALILSSWGALGLTFLIFKMDSLTHYSLGLLCRLMKQSKSHFKRNGTDVSTRTALLPSHFL